MTSLKSLVVAEQACKQSPKRGEITWVMQRRQNVPPPSSTNQSPVRVCRCPAYIRITGKTTDVFVEDGGAGDAKQ